MSNESRFDPFDIASADATAAPAEGPGLTPAQRRFYACRWHKAAESGLAAHCTHRDVIPMAGTSGFAADAWCTDCSHYKVRRSPRRPSYS